MHDCCKLILLMNLDRHLKLLVDVMYVTMEMWNKSLLKTSIVKLSVFIVFIFRQKARHILDQQNNLGFEG